MTRGTERREQILLAATALLLEEGHAGFSVRGVAARAGIGLSHVQYYFPEPSSIVSALLDRFIARYSEQVIALFRHGKGTPMMKLQKALEFLLNDEAYRNECAVFMLEVSAFAARDKKISEAVERYYAAYFEAFEIIAAEIGPALSRSQRSVRVLQCVALIEGMAASRRYLGAEGDRAFSARAAAQAIERLLAE